MCFCETNRIGFDEKTGAKWLWGNVMRSGRGRISIRFVWGEMAGAGRKRQRLLPQTKAAFATGIRRGACRQTPLRLTRLDKLRVTKWGGREGAQPERLRYNSEGVL